MAAAGVRSNSAGSVDPRPSSHPGHYLSDFHVSGKARVDIGNKNYDHSTNYIYGSPVQADENEQACRKALFLTDPRVDRERYVDSKGHRVPGTCQWILENEKFKLWRDARSQLLWLSGGPGKGKTFLSMYLAEELRKIADNSANIIFLEYYCDNKDEKRNTALGILRGLIFLVLEQRPGTIHYLLDQFNFQKESLFSSESSFATLWHIFQRMLADPSIGQVYLVLDALDELDECDVEAENFIKRLKILFTSEKSEFSATRLQMIVVSREYPQYIPRALGSGARITLDSDSDEVNEDLKLFISVKVDEYFSGISDPGDLPERLRKDLLRRADATFLWAGFAMQILENVTRSEIPKALQDLPTGLDSMYRRMLLQIRKNRREKAAAILRWVVMAVQPLTISELSTAMNIPAEPKAGLSRSDVLRDDISFCGCLLTISNDGEIGLVHQSAKDYLLGKGCDLAPELEVFRVHESKANFEIAKRCLDYINDGAFAQGAVQILEQEDRPKDLPQPRSYPFVYYAAMHWPEHARGLADKTEATFLLSMQMFQDVSPVREAWVKTYWAAKSQGASAPETFTPLHVASYFGMVRLVSGLLLDPERIVLNPVNQKDSNGGTPLLYAALNGHTKVVQLLLEKGADFEAKDNNGWTALWYAARLQHEAMVRLLLEKGADIEAKDNNGWTALWYAAQLQHEAIVRLLLEKGADIEAKDNNGWTALCYAAQLQHEAIVRLLLEKGADIETKGNNRRIVMY